MKISILIICNKLRIAKLERLLESMKSQVEDYDAEIIILHESVKKLKKPVLPLDVKYINIAPDRGIPFNRNQGVKYSKGEIIIFIDDDCWVNKNWLKWLMLPLKNDKNLMAVTSGTKVPKSNLIGDCIAALGFPGGGSLGFRNVWKVSKDGYTNHLAVGNCALRKSVFSVIGQFDETLKSGAEDAELSFRMEKEGILIKYVPGAYAYHEARDTLSSFISWQIRRGKANYQFKKKVGPVSQFVKLRLWSAKNIIKKKIMDPKFFLILTLLFFSFILQQIGYIYEKLHNE
ncbi:MAG: glycosyltransferase family 2 protein [Nanoarchaeota archaeon]